MVLLFIYFFIATGVSFLCSLWEAVLLSITPAYTQIKMQEGAPMGQKLAAFKDDIDQPLAAILTLNTIAHTVGAIGVGQQATVIWGDTQPWITAFVIPVVVTLGILVLSELIPKTLGASHWQRFAPFTVKSLSLLLMVLKPLILMSQWITSGLKKDKDATLFTRSDFLAMAEIGAKEGVFEEQEAGLIRSLLAFKDVRAKDAMTPRLVVRSMASEMTVAEFQRAVEGLPFSRIPIYHEAERERITGYVLKSELLGLSEAADLARPIGDFQRALDYIAEDHPITDLLSRFLSRREHLAVVLDDYGGLSGLVTMEDVIETLLGVEIVDESDKTPDMQLMARRSWQRRAKRLGLVSEGEESAGPGSA